MNDYVEVRIDLNPCCEDITDVAAAMLADVGFESFVADENGLTAYIRSGEYSDDKRNVLDDFPFVCRMEWSSKVIEGKDWNKEWEQNYFKPIVVADRCVIHSSFHTDFPKCEYDIVIDPKMAFGTGHHSTTWLIISQLVDMDIKGKNVIDMGTGTGILAILAAMRGAARVTGIEIDEAAYVNALENRVLNSHPEVVMLLGDAAKLSEVGYNADLFLANINRNVITSDLHDYALSMNVGGTMLLSGFYEQDVPLVVAEAEKYGLSMVGYTTRQQWACVRLVKN